MAGKTTSAIKKTADLLDSGDDDDLFKTKRFKTLTENPYLQSPPPQEMAGASIKTSADLLDSDDDDDLLKPKSPSLQSPPPKEIPGASTSAIKKTSDLLNTTDDHRPFRTLLENYLHQQYLALKETAGASTSAIKKTAPISVEDRDLNIAILASLQTAAGIDGDSDSIDLAWFDHEALETIRESGQSSNSNPPKPEFICEICAEEKTVDESFPIKGCSHGYCKQCTAKYISSKLHENVSIINCPVSGCGGSLELEICESILPSEVFDKWGNSLCEALILGDQKFYCPFKDCSAMLVYDDGNDDDDDVVVITQSECPHCHRLFCARCRVPLHSEIDCDEFRRRIKDEREKEGDMMLVNLAGRKMWKRCPSCKFFVERSSGCRYIKCRCGTDFCYGCGGTCIGVATHVCTKCG